MIAVAVDLATFDVILEVRVVARLFGGDAAGGVVHEHHLEQIKPCIVHIGAERVVRITLPLGEGDLEVGVRGYAGPDLFGGCAEQPDSILLASHVGTL